MTPGVAAGIEGGQYMAWRKRIQHAPESAAGSRYSLVGTLFEIRLVFGCLEYSAEDGKAVEGQ